MKKIIVFIGIVLYTLSIVPSVFATACKDLEYIILNNGDHVIAEPLDNDNPTDNFDAWLVHQAQEGIEEVGDRALGSHFEAEWNDVRQRSDSNGFDAIGFQAPDNHGLIAPGQDQHAYIIVEAEQGLTTSQYWDAFKNLPFHISLSGDDCPESLRDNNYSLQYREQNYFSTDLNFANLPPGITCEVHIKLDNQELCDFNNVDIDNDGNEKNDGKLRTSGTRDNSIESQQLLDSVNGVDIGDIGNLGQSFQASSIELCQNYGGDASENCLACHTSGGVYTGIGCVPVGNMTAFIATLLNYAAGIGGGITFLMIIAGGFTILTSSGNPEKLQTGKEIITNAIAGLLLIIFSAVILRIIGVDILQIPGFGK